MPADHLRDFVLKIAVGQLLLPGRRGLIGTTPFDKLFSKIINERSGNFAECVRRSTMNHEFRVFDIVQPIGMFATLTYCTLLAKACEEKGIEPYIIVSSPFYLSPGRGGDWFSYFFGHKRLQLSDTDLAALRKENKIYLVRDRGDINLLARGSVKREISNDFSTFSEATRLFDKYFFVKMEVMDRINRFYESHFNSNGQLGIHFRGTDHDTEYKFVDYAVVTNAASRYFPQFQSVFIATDEQEFLAFARSQMPDKNIVTFSQTTPGLHTIDQGDNYDKGFHALADCLLLSRCKALVKTPSALSTWSKVFATDMDVVLVGKPYSNPWKHLFPWYNLNGLGYFPESLLYCWNKDAMAENRVRDIIADPPRIGHFSRFFSFGRH
jgi:hypothetical protein